MNYAECLEYLYNQLPMYQRVGKAAYKADLNNTHKLMDILDHPHQNFKSIHIGGTNGKGSTSHMLASILLESGYKVGLYTSPHLKDFRERIRINGEMIPKENITEFVNQYKHDFEKIELSFFEWTVGLCFEYFAKEKVDIAVIEVGMGGRLDSTNVIQPLISIITNIGLDHTQFLGDTKAKIAVEKAGIIKKNVPVIIGSYTDETKHIFLTAAEKHSAPISFASELSYEIIYPCDLLGDYQLANQKTVRGALPYLNKNGFHISETNVLKGFENVVKNTSLLGRWQIISDSPLTICDTAHNEDGLMAVLKQIKGLKFDRAHFVLGMVSDKDVKSILKLFPTSASYYFCKPNILRGLDATTLKNEAFEVGMTGLHYDSVQSALKAAQNNAESNDLIYVGGSTFVVAEVI